MREDVIRYHYYINDDNDRLFKAKIRYILYGSIILALAIALFVLELFEGFGITQVLDYFISVSMFSDMIIGIIYIVKGILLKNGIRAKFIFNMVDSKIEDNNIKTRAGVIRYLSIIPVVFNISILVFYISTLYYKADSISFYMVFSFVIGVLLNIGCIMAMISLDGENLIFDRIDE